MRPSSLEADIVRESPGGHFPKLAFKKLVRLGGVTKRSEFTPHELRRLEKRFPTWTRRIGKMIEVTAKAWTMLAEMGVDANTLKPILESGEYCVLVD